MKVYRYLKWSDCKYDGSLNELINLEKMGLISPSYSYLWKRAMTDATGARNTFGTQIEMRKYFFASLADATFDGIENLLMEIDLPEELLRRYIGIGYYGDLKVEYCIPYKVLYESVATRKQDYTLRALDFYNANLFSNDLDTQTGYKEIESLLSNVPYQGIQGIKRLSIYPLFCFESKSVSLVEVKEDASKHIEMLNSAREKRFHYERKIAEIASASHDLAIYDKSYSKDKLFDFSVPIIEEENEELRRILLKKD